MKCYFWFKQNKIGPWKIGHRNETNEKNPLKWITEKRIYQSETSYVTSLCYFLCMFYFNLCLTLMDFHLSSIFKGPIFNLGWDRQTYFQKWWPFYKNLHFWKSILSSVNRFSNGRMMVRNFEVRRAKTRIAHLHTMVQNKFRV